MAYPQPQPLDPKKRLLQQPGLVAEGSPPGVGAPAPVPVPQPPPPPPGPLSTTPTRGPGPMTAPPLPAPAPTPGPAPSGPNDPNFWVTLPSGQKVPYNHPLAQPAAAGGPTAPGTSSAPGTPAPGPTAPAGPAVPNFEDQIRQSILTRLGQSENPSPDDPIIQAQMNARRTSNQRAEERLRGELAEQNAAEGQERGAINPAMLAAGQRRGEDEADFSANLIAQQQQQRAENIRQALQVGAGILNADEQRALQKELADLELALKNRGLDIQAGLGGRELDIRQRLGEGGLSLGLLQALLGRTNFLDQLGFDYGAFQHDANRRSVLDLL